MHPETLALSRSEVATALRISLRTVDYLIAEGKLRSRRIGRRVLILRSEVEAFLNETRSKRRAV